MAPRALGLALALHRAFHNRRLGSKQRPRSGSEARQTELITRPDRRSGFQGWNRPGRGPLPCSARNRERRLLRSAPADGPAPRLAAKDVLLALSFSGRTSDLVSNIEIAKKAGARIVAISPGGSVVASRADENTNLNDYRASTHPLIVPTGRAPMYVMRDTFSALLARKCEAGTQ
ncbi:SIS domain-containing protein [Ensifer adhaerens]|uniref:SIS domain-containing protein n=1 Tax=Ensifer adhaerens TaxID=106592 RepID=UPI003CFCCCBA